MNNNVTIYIGDIKLNPESHCFIETYDESVLNNSFSFDKRITFIDIDYLNLNKSDIKNIVSNAKNKTILCTLYPDKIDKKLDVRITYKDGWIDDSGEDLYQIVKACFHQKDRFKLRNLLKESKISTHFLNKWLHCNPTNDNFNVLKILDYYSVNRNPDIWIDLVSILLHDGPSYPAYKYKRHNDS